MDDQASKDTLANGHCGLCLSCDYPLQAKYANRCPECGRPFDASDPLTMNLGPPLGRLRGLIRPPSVPAIVLAVIATATLLLLSRWPVRGSHFALNDLRYFGQIHWWPAWAFSLTLIDCACLLAMIAWVIVGIRWIVRSVITMTWMARSRSYLPPTGDYNRRQFLLLLAGFAGAASVAWGWAFRMGRRWVWEQLQVNPGSMNAACPGRLTVDDQIVALRAGIIQLPTPRERLAALRLLIEEHADRAVPVLTDAVRREQDSAIRCAELRLLGLFRDRTSAPLLAQFMSNGDPASRAAAADALGLLRHPPFAPVRIEVPNGRSSLRALG